MKKFKILDSIKGPVYNYEPVNYVTNIFACSFTWLTPLTWHSTRVPTRFATLRNCQWDLTKSIRKIRLLRDPICIRFTNFRTNSLIPIFSKEMMSMVRRFTYLKQTYEKTETLSLFRKLFCIFPICLYQFLLVQTSFNGHSYIM